MPGNWSTAISDPRISGLKNGCRSEGAMLIQFEDIYPGSRVVDHIRHIWVLFFCRLVSPVGDNSSVFVWEAPAFVFHGNLTLPPNATHQEVKPLLKGYWDLASRIIKGQWWFPNPSEGLLKPGGGSGDLTYGTLQGHFDDVREVGAGHGICGGPLLGHVWEATLFLTKSWVSPAKNTWIADS